MLLPACGVYDLLLSFTRAAHHPHRYTEDCHPPGLQFIPIHELTNGEYSATPVLVYPNGDVVTDSAAILADLHAKFPAELGWLYPEGIADEVRELERSIEVELGANIRQVAYTYVGTLCILVYPEVLKEWREN